MAGSFTADLSRFCTKSDKKMTDFVRLITLNAFQKIILRSPVGDPSGWKNPERAPAGYVGGRFRANWGVAMGSAWLGTVEAVDKEGTATVSKARAGVMKWNCQGSIFLTNNLPYSIKLEEGYSTGQAPDGMVKVTLEEIHAWLQTGARQ